MDTGAQGAQEAHVKLLEGPEQRDTLLALFAQTAREQAWQPEAQLRAYQEHSVYFGAYVGDDLAGGLHLVLGGTDCLPVLTVWPELYLRGRQDVADVALVAVLPPYRAGYDLLWRLFVAMWRWCAMHGIAELWAEVPVSRLRLYNRLGWNLHVVGPTRLHWGEACCPCQVGIRELEDSFAARARFSKVSARHLAQAHSGYTTQSGLRDAQNRGSM